MACRGAVALGVDQVQVDVRLSSDGEVVVLHDPTLDRTTDGSGPVHLRPWSELSTIHLRHTQGEMIPTLDAVIRVLKTGNARLRLELKSSPSDAVRQDLPERVVDILDQAGFLPRSILTSFAKADLARIRGLAPNVPLAWMLDAPTTLAWTAVSVDAALDPGNCHDRRSARSNHTGLTVQSRRSWIAALLLRGKRCCCSPQVARGNSS